MVAAGSHDGGGKDGTVQPWGGGADDRLEGLLGRSLPGRIDGATPLAAPVVLHVAAVAPIDGVRRVLRIGEQTPRSAVDFYLLSSTRAWADVVLTSGKILRDEPDLSFALSGPNDAAMRSLVEARTRRTNEPLRIAVLSSGTGLDEKMPVWRGGGEFTLVTNADGAERIDEWAGRAGVGVVSLDSVGPRTAVEWARRAAAGDGVAGRVSVELGANSSMNLYPSFERPADESGVAPLVDVLLLSEYLGPVPDAVRGDRFLPGVEIEDLYAPGPESRDGAWRFCCWTRR